MSNCAVKYVVTWCKKLTLKHCYCSAEETKWRGKSAAPFNTQTPLSLFHHPCIYTLLKTLSHSLTNWQKLSLHKALYSIIYRDPRPSHVEFSQNKFK